MTSKVFLLGAGFSKALGHSMPIMWELAHQVRNEIARTGPQLPPEHEAFGEDLEALLSYLAEDQPWLNDERRLHNRATFAQVSRVISEVINAAQRHTVQQPERPWLRPLIDYWSETPARLSRSTTTCS